MYSKQPDVKKTATAKIVKNPCCKEHFFCLCIRLQVNSAVRFAPEDAQEKQLL